MPEQPNIEKVVPQGGLEQKSVAEVVTAVGAATGGVGALMQGGASLINAIRPSQPSKPAEHQPPTEK